jgi:hypothetical protein
LPENNGAARWCVKNVAVLPPQRLGGSKIKKRIALLQ